MDKSFKRVSTWGKVFGILMMISGGISALSGIFAMGVGAIPGIISIWLGYLLFQSGKDADVYINDPTLENKDRIVVGYAKYLFISGIMICVIMAVSLIGIALAFLLGLASTL